MSEADEIADRLIAEYGNPHVRSWDEARAWVMSVWPDATEWIGHQQLANIAESVMRSAKPEGATNG